jgi:hypothetical protein
MFVKLFAIKKVYLGKLHDPGEEEGGMGLKGDTDKS